MTNQKDTFEFVHLRSSCEIFLLYEGTLYLLLWYQSDVWKPLSQYLFLKDSKAVLEWMGEPKLFLNTSIFSFNTEAATKGVL